MSIVGLHRDLRPQAAGARYLSRALSACRSRCQILRSIKAAGPALLSQRCFELVRCVDASDPLPIALIVTWCCTIDWDKCAKL